MLPVKSTKAQLQAANEILVEASGQLLNMVADLQEENAKLKEQLESQYHPTASTRQNHDRLLQHIFKELGYNEPT